MGVSKWLERNAMRDLEKWERINPAYDEQHHVPDNERLFYIQQRLGHINRSLSKIELVLGAIAGTVGAATARYFGWF
jgi:hypothetical protein